jgi:hypothetical protein
MSAPAPNTCTATSTLTITPLTSMLVEAAGVSSRLPSCVCGVMHPAVRGTGLGAACLLQCCCLATLAAHPLTLLFPSAYACPCLCRMAALLKTASKSFTCCQPLQYMHPSSSQFLTEAELKAALGLPSGWSLTRMDALLVGGPRPCGGPGAGQGPLGAARPQ